MVVVVVGKNCIIDYPAELYSSSSQAARWGFARQVRKLQLFFLFFTCTSTLQSSDLSATHQRYYSKRGLSIPTLPTPPLQYFF